MDFVLNIKNFALLESTLTDKNALKSLKLLCIFGCNGAEVIYATIDDKVYGFGRNRFGGLGLGTDEENIERPQLNKFLTNKRIANIFCGFEHWIALTTSGRCYVWGHNNLGQFGLKNVDQSNTPLFIEELTNQTIVDISCGAAHTLAITSSGQLYGWGDNQYGQIGDGSSHLRFNPRLVPFDEEVISVSCGRNHSMALTASRHLYVWGLNSYGQLGYCVDNIRFISTRPQLITGYESVLFSKIICGPNYSLVLSTDGYIYTFGDNTCGQIGNGSTNSQSTPFQVSNDIQFKDIIAHKENDISIAFSVDNTFYVWGLAKNRRYLRPKQIKDSSGHSVFDIYAIYAKKNVTFKTVVINNELKSWERSYRNDLQSEDFGEVEVNRETSFDVLSINSEVNDINDNIDSDNNSNGWQQIKRSKVKKPKTRQITLDKVINIKAFLKNPKIIEDSMIRHIRLIRVFGLYGSKVIFATHDDKVYAFGHNRDLSLGLGTTEEHILQAEVVKELCGKQLVDIATGYEHCIALTSSGQCYGWGQNSFGQLGIGTIIASKKPKLIEELVDTKVVQIACGSYHSLALTSDGELFSWGHNTFAQLGDRTYNSRENPTQVMIPEVIRYICCGLNHSVALSFEGRIYVWGGNENGQLGRSPEKDIRESREKPMSNRPHVISYFEKTVIKKTVCGSNHTLVLTNDGDIYAFGENSSGQVGNGTTINQFTPIKLNKEIKIRDIISHFDNDMSIAVAENNKCFIWGFVQNKNVCRPTEITNPLGKSLFDIYAKFAKHKVTFKTVVVEHDFNDYVIQSESIANNKQLIKTSKTSDSMSYSQITASNNQKLSTDSNCDLNEDKNSIIESINDLEEMEENVSPIEDNTRTDEVFATCHSNNINIQNSVHTFDEENKLSDNYSNNGDFMSVKTKQKEITVCGNIFLNHLRQSFDSRDNSDLQIRCGDKIIYCHKTILEIRNIRFWETLKEQLSEEINNQIIINPNSYPLFYAFLQYVYTIKPEVNLLFAKDLQKMAQLFREPQLEDLCAQLIQKSEFIINGENVCKFYEKAINECLTDLEKSCVEYAANNWKSVVKSESFEALSDSLSKKLMISIFNV